MRHILKLAAIALLAIGSTGPQAFAATKINLLYIPGGDFVPSYVAKDQGIFERHGLDVDMSIAQNGSVISAAMAADQAQIGTLTPPVLLQANEQGLDLVVVAGGTATPDPAGTSGMLARTGSDIKTAKDLVGRKIGVPGLGGTFDLLAKKWVESKGVDYRKINWVEVPFTRMGDTMKAGLVDVVAATLPFYARIVDAKIGYDIGDIYAPLPDGALLAFYGSSRDWARKNPEVVKAFRASLDEAVAFIADSSHAAKVQEILAKYTKLPVGAEPPPVPTTLHVHVKPDALAFWIDVMHEQGVIGKAHLDPTSFIAP